ncbi:DUF6461 domain-containing protein [Streptomyces sp. NPDC004732]|uniref:DUF6461 domain-containing protein n=1 Tax=Streptomyces sp. NPDC004732 TaxID=3154290 RepID=UPI0033A82EA3
MNNGLLWLPSAYSEGFSVAFCAGESAQGMLAKMGADPAHMIALSGGEAEAIEMHNFEPDDTDLESIDLDVTELQEHGFLGPDAVILRAGSFDGWAFAIQSFGTYATDARMNERISVETQCISYSRTVNADTWVQYAKHGEIVDSFDPFVPGAADPDWLDLDELAAAHDENAYVLGRLESHFNLYVPSGESTERLSRPRS